MLQLLVSSFYSLLERDSNLDFVLVLLVITGADITFIGQLDKGVPLGSSLGHVLTSAILFAFLTIALVVAQCRKKQVAFTLVNVAAALANSDVPQKSVEMTQFKVGAGDRERKVLKLVPGGDGRLYCVYESVD